MNYSISLATHPATSSLGTRCRARTNVCDVTAEHAVSCLSDELRCSVDESPHLDDAKQIVS